MVTKTAESKERIQEGNGVIEITHGYPIEVLSSVPILKLATVFEEFLKTSDLRQNAIAEAHKADVPELLSKYRPLIGTPQKRLVTLFDGDENPTAILRGSAAEHNLLEVRLDMLNATLGTIPKAFVSNVFVVEALSIIHDVLIGNEVGNKTPAPEWLKTLRIPHIVTRSRSGDCLIVDTQIPRIVKNGNACVSSLQGSADTGFGMRRETDDGEAVTVNASIDGVTVPGSPNADLIARDASIECNKKAEVQELFLGVHTVQDMLNAVKCYDDAFTEAVERRKSNAGEVNPHATGAFTVVRKQPKGPYKVMSAVIGDTKSTAVWVDSKGELHVRTISSPINKDFDALSTGYGRAIAKGFESLQRILTQWYKNSYIDKYNAGERSVAVFGERQLFSGEDPRSIQGNKHVAIDTFEIPADARYVNVFTSTDGLDLYASLLGVPPWVAYFALNNGLNIAYVGDKPFPLIKQLFAPNVIESLFTSPVGIAGLQGAYMVHHLDCMDGEPRPKIDDLHTSSSSWGNADDFLELLYKKAESVIYQPTAKSYANEINRLAAIWTELYRYIIATKPGSRISAQMKHRHKKK